MTMTSHGQTCLGWSVPQGKTSHSSMRGRCGLQHNGGSFRVCLEIRVPHNRLRSLHNKRPCAVVSPSGLRKVAQGRRAISIVGICSEWVNTLKCVSIDSACRDVCGRGEVESRGNRKLEPGRFQRTFCLRMVIVRDRAPSHGHQTYVRNNGTLRAFE